MYRDYHGQTSSEHPTSGLMWTIRLFAALLILVGTALVISAQFAQKDAGAGLATLGMICGGIGLPFFLLSFVKRIV